MDQYNAKQINPIKKKGTAIRWSTGEKVDSVEEMDSVEEVDSKRWTVWKR
jgi:hypothetical protein